MVKNGGVSSSLKFCINEKSESVYRTTAGAVLMEVDTKDIYISDTDDMICACVRYALNINGQFISNCEAYVKIQAA